MATQEETDPTCAMADQALALELLKEAFALAQEGELPLQTHTGVAVMRLLTKARYTNEKTSEFLLAIQQVTLYELDVWPFLPAQTNHFDRLNHQNSHADFMCEVINKLIFLLKNRIRSKTF